MTDLIRWYIMEVCADDDFDLSDVLATAQLAHLGQTRRSGEPYLEHPLEVARIVRSYYPEDKILCTAALLHDTLEDAVEQGNVKDNQEMEELIRGSYLDPSDGRRALGIVMALTHEKNEPYVQYVVDLASNPSALRIKLADMLHNLKSSPSERQVLKYGSAIQALENEYSGIPAGISQKHWSALKSHTQSSLVENILRLYIKKII